ncbi:MAG: type II toxin-antitoxin system VapC family toxin [Nitrospinota bacterium]
MMFWDASAIIPLCLDEPQTKVIRNISGQDGAIVAWWGSTIECYSAFARLRRERLLNNREEEQLRNVLNMLSGSWTEIKPSQDIRNLAARLLLLHPLRAADSLQLAAALVWAEKSPKRHGFVCLDNRLKEAANKEGFALLPSEEEE